MDVERAWAPQKRMSSEEWMVTVRAAMAFGDDKREDAHVDIFKSDVDHVSACFTANCNTVSTAGGDVAKHNVICRDNVKNICS